MIGGLTNPYRGHIFAWLYRGTQLMAYTKAYWEKNGGTIAERRKQRYANDPEYRQAVKDRSRAYRENQRNKREAFLENPYVVIAGKHVMAKLVTDACATIGITEPRLKYLQRTGYVPAALVVRPARLYTENQITLITQIEAFLTEHSKHLRSTRTQAGLLAQNSLDAHINTIASNWEK